MVVSVIMFNVHNWKGVYMSSGMFGYVDVLKTAADASWAREEVLTNNIANVDTPNYKRQDVEFTTYLKSALSRSGGDSTSLTSKIEALGGDVEVKTKYGEGSTFSIRLPLTLAIIQALMVKLGDEKYAISLGAIETIEDVPVTDIKYIHAKEVINLRGSVIPLIRLRDILDVPGEQEESDTITVVIVRKGDKLAGLVVDSLIGQMEIVIKSLGKYININRMISGATILGDGSVALIIDANTLV